MKKQVLILIASIIMIFSVQHLCWAKDTARLQAGNIHFDKDADLVTAEGEVKITYKELTITADRVYIAVKDRQMVAKGHVDVQRNDSSFSGDEFTYDFKEERGILQPMELEIVDNAIKGKILGKGRQLEIEGDTHIIHFGNVTTCDWERPHYYFSAKRLEYVPDDYIILRNAIYHEGKIPLLYWPYLYISLKDDESNFKTPVLGHDERQGWYLYLGYNYFTDQWGKGELLLDLMEKLGMGYGVRHTYAWDNDSRVIGEIYRLDDRNTGFSNDRVILRYEDRFDGGWSLRTAAKWEEETVTVAQRQYKQTDDLEIDTQLSYAGKRLGFTNVLDFWFQDSQRSIYWNPNFQIRLFDNGRLSLNGTWNERYYEATDLTNHNYYATLAYHQNIHGYQLDTSFSRATDQRDEIRLTSPSFKLPWFPAVGWTLQANRIVPTPISGRPDQEGTRLGLTVDGKSSPIFKPSDDFQIFFAWSVKERYYFTTEGDGDLFAVNGSINAEKRFSPSWVGKVGLGWTEVNDHSPNFANLMESIYHGGDLTYNLRFNQEAISASYSGGYNLTNGLWNDQNLALSWKPTPNNSLSVALNFDPERNYGYTTTSWTYRSDDRHYVSLEHRLYKYAYSSDSETLNINVNFEQPIGENFSVHLVSRYDLLHDFINDARLTVSYRWHCRTLMLGYDYYRNTILFQFMINAFPDSQLSFNGDDGFVWDSFYNPWRSGVR